VSSAANAVTLDVQTINNYPASDFSFAGNGATTPIASAFAVNTALTGLPAGVAAGDPLWITGYVTPFGTAPPDFTAFSVNDQSSVQVAGAAVGSGSPTTPGNGICGIGSQVCMPAVLSVAWSPSAKVTAPFTSLTSTGFTIDPAKVSQATIRIGPESIDLTSSSVVSPLIVATSLPATSTFAPRYMVGNPYTSTTTPTVTAATGAAFDTFSNLPDFVTSLQSQLTSTAPAFQMTASGIYDPATNTFTATTIDFVL
jgi:hypothetical protein